MSEWWIDYSDPGPSLKLLEEITGELRIETPKYSQIISKQWEIGVYPDKCSYETFMEIEPSWIVQTGSGEGSRVYLNGNYVGRYHSSELENGKYNINCITYIPEEEPWSLSPSAQPLSMLHSSVLRDIRQNTSTGVKVSAGLQHLSELASMERSSSTSRRRFSKGPRRLR